MGLTAAIILILVVIVLIFVALIYNKLVSARQLVNNGWSDIDVQLKRRVDLIPRLVETVKGYASHEKKLFGEIVDKRNAALAAQSLSDRASAEGALKAPLGRMLAIAEDYPDLKANSNFLDLQNELSETEDKIEYARRFYNGAVRQMNIRVQSFPTNLLAGLFGFGSHDYFEMDEQASMPIMDFEN